MARKSNIKHSVSELSSLVYYSYMKTRFPKERENEVCSDYSGGMETKNICLKYKFTPPALYRILKNNNTEKRGHPVIDKSTIDKIIQLVQNGSTVKSACTVLGVSKSSAGTYLKERGIKVKKRGQFTRKYNIDETYFEKLDSPEKAQVMGVLLSDGTSSSFNKAISLRLEESDIEYLEKIRVLIGSDKPLYYSEGRNFQSPLNEKLYIGNRTAILDITNKKIHSDCAKFGLIPRKTWLNIGAPKDFLTTPELKRGFVLGVFNGDGCISWTRKNNVYDLSFAGSSNMTKDIYDFIKETLGIEGRIYKHSSIFVLHYKRIKEIIQLINWMYEGGDFCMKRKFDKCKVLLEIFKEKGYLID